MVGVAAEPLTWNGLLVTDLVSSTITKRLHATLTRVNPVTQEVEAELAESWAYSDDGTVLTFRLRSGIRFSDGSPFSAKDVEFTFRALHDPRVASPLTETAKVDGRPLTAEVIDPQTVRFQLPRRTAVVERLFDSIDILPGHRLDEALEQGTFASVYGIGARAERIVGLGPFVLDRYLPGQRVVLRRNPHYWKTGPDGRPLPQLEGILFEVLPDANARMLKLRNGEVDLLGELQPDDFIQLRDRHLPHLRLLDLGPGMMPERLWFNLNPESPNVSPGKRLTFSEVSFRRAVSLAVDREAIVQAVYRGLASPATGPVSPANRFWRNEGIEPPVLDRGRARTVLRDAGFRWDSEGHLLDSGGEPVSFTLISNAENLHRTRAAVLLQEDLAALGIDMRFAPLDRLSLLGRVTKSFDYDACLLGVTQTEPDPSAEIPLWLSSAPLHLWHPSQASPATDWEAEIDDLMQRQMLALSRAERKSLYDRVQAILAEQVPLIDLVVPHVLLGVSRRVQNLKPTPFWTPPLWNCEELWLRPTGGQ